MASVAPASPSLAAAAATPISQARPSGQKLDELTENIDSFRKETIAKANRLANKLIQEIQEFYGRMDDLIKQTNALKSVSIYRERVAGTDYTIFSKKWHELINDCKQINSSSLAISATIQGNTTISKLIRSNNELQKKFQKKSQHVLRSLQDRHKRETKKDGETLLASEDLFIFFDDLLQRVCRYLTTDENVAANAELAAQEDFELIDIESESESALEKNLTPAATRVINDLS